MEFYGITFPRSVRAGAHGRSLDSKASALEQALQAFQKNPSEASLASPATGLDTSHFV